MNQRRSKLINLNTSFAILMILLIPKCSDALFESCAHTFYVNAEYPSDLESPLYPNNYTTGTSCIYHFIAPVDYELEVKCTLEMDTGKSGCTSEFFFFSIDGDTQLRGAEQFCGFGNFVRKSLFRSVTIGYVSKKTWGRYQCRLEAIRQPCDCGWSTGSKTLNGKKIEINAYPSMVSLRDKTSKEKSYCGATIITHQFILTAAHCARLQPDPKKIIAVMGDHVLTDKSETYFTVEHEILQIIEHPKFNKETLENNLALMETLITIEWTQGVGRICLPSPELPVNYFDNQNADTIGWGTSTFGGTLTNSLHKVDVQILDNKTCQKTYGNAANISSSDICTYDSKGSSKDSCQFDAGGPVIYWSVKQFLVGTISYGKVCGLPGAAIGVSARITSYVGWIKQNVGEGSDTCFYEFI